MWDIFRPLPFHPTEHTQQKDVVTFWLSRNRYIAQKMNTILDDVSCLDLLTVWLKLVDRFWSLFHITGLVLGKKGLHYHHEFVTFILVVFIVLISSAVVHGRCWYFLINWWLIWWVLMTLYNLWFYDSKCNGVRLLKSNHCCYLYDYVWSYGSRKLYLYPFQLIVSSIFGRDT